MPKFTTLKRNEARNTSDYEGTFDDLISAQAYATTEAGRSRKFATWEIWTGTPQSPGKPVGPVTRGTK